MVAGGGPAGQVHPHLAEGAGQRHLARRCRNLLVLVLQLLLDQSLREVRISLALLLQPKYNRKIIKVKCSALVGMDKPVY